MTYLSHIGTQTKLWASAECTGEDKPGLFITDHLSSLWISTSFWKQLYLKANVIYFVKSRFFPESRTAPQCSNRTLVSNCWNVVRDENKSGVISPQLISEQWETGAEAGHAISNYYDGIVLVFLIFSPWSQLISDGEHRWTVQLRCGGSGAGRGWPWGRWSRGQKQWRLQVWPFQKKQVRRGEQHECSGWFSICLNGY